jgi:hypothetical protein
MIYCFDLDETLCKTSGQDYENSTPIPVRINKVVELFDSGHIIKIHTARGSVTGLDWTEVTRNQLKAWGCPFHELILGKPAADIYIDDKACKDLDFDWS